MRVQSDLNADTYRNWVCFLLVDWIIRLTIFFFRTKFDTFDILENEEVRQGLKTYSNWPTYPQVYVKGQLIGGLDIVKVRDFLGIWGG